MNLIATVFATISVNAVCTYFILSPILHIQNPTRYRIMDKGWKIISGHARIGTKEGLAQAILIFVLPLGTLYLTYITLKCLIFGLLGGVKWIKNLD